MRVPSFPTEPELIERRDEDLEEEPLGEPRQPPRRREPAEESLLPGPVRAVLLRDHVRRRALVDVQLADTAGDGGDDLDRARPGADHSHPLAVEIDLVVPARGVEDRALEAFRALDPAERRAAELSAGRDQHVGLEGLPRSSLDSPAARALVELRPSHLGPQPQVAPQPVAYRRSARGSRGSPAAASSAGSSPGWARTRTSRAARARRRSAPG